MPAVRKPKLHRFTIKRGDLAGLIVQTRSVSIGEWRKMFPGDDDSEAGDTQGDMITKFASVLHSWDLVDEDGRPVPATLDELEQLDMMDAKILVSTWLDSLSDVDDELGKESPNGAPSLAPSIPMTPLEG
jgi:hypothetical protein